MQGLQCPKRGILHDSMDASVARTRPQAPPEKAIRPASLFCQAGTPLALRASMRAAIPIWQGRVSPVFDVASRLLLVDISDGQEVGRRLVGLRPSHAHRRARDVADLGTEVLICGAVSRPLEMSLAALGVDVISQTCGDVEQVLRAYMDGRLSRRAFLMPGCYKRGRHFRGRRRRGG